MISYVANSHDSSKEYKVICEIAEGCPIVNGACPTCTIVGRSFKRVTNEEIDAWAKRMQERNKYVPLENDPPEGESSGWEWNGPTWKGLRVLY